MLLYHAHKMGTHIFQMPEREAEDTLAGLLHIERERILVQTVRSIYSSLVEAAVFPTLLYWCQQYAHEANFGITQPTTAVDLSHRIPDIHATFLTYFSSYCAQFILNDFHKVLETKLLTALQTWAEGGEINQAENKFKLIRLLRAIIPQYWESLAGEEESRLYQIVHLQEGESARYIINDAFRDHLPANIIIALRNANIVCSPEQTAAAEETLSRFTPSARLALMASHTFQSNGKLIHAFNLYLYLSCLHEHQSAGHLLSLERLLEMMGTFYGLIYFSRHKQTYFLQSIAALEPASQLIFFKSLSTLIDNRYTSFDQHFSRFLYLCEFNASEFMVLWRSFVAIASHDPLLLQTLYNGLIVDGKEWDMSELGVPKRPPYSLFSYCLLHLTPEDKVSLFLQISRTSTQSIFRVSLLETLCTHHHVRYCAPLVSLIFKTTYPLAIIKNMNDRIHNKAQALSALERTIQQTTPETITVIKEGEERLYTKASVLEDRTISSVDFKAVYVQEENRAEHIATLVWQRILNLASLGKHHHLLLKTLCFEFSVEGGVTLPLMFYAMASVLETALPTLWGQIEALAVYDGAPHPEHYPLWEKAINAKDLRLSISTASLYQYRSRHGIAGGAAAAFSMGDGVAGTEETQVSFGR